VICSYDVWNSASGVAETEDNSPHACATVAFALRAVADAVRTRRIKSQSRDWSPLIEAGIVEYHPRLIS
jgi:hypothetical protein